MVKLSIIIPYYDTYELTEKLLKELYVQSNKEVEIILVDDGCDEKKLDTFKYLYCLNNLHIIHKKNGGVSSARNKGLDMVKGEYVAFIDSDDMIMPYYVESLLELIKTHNEDIIYFNWLDKTSNDVIRYPKNPAVWKAIYKREILPRFEECYKAKEDYFFLHELGKTNHSEYYYDRVLYIYNSCRENSLTQRDKRGELQ